MFLCVCVKLKWDFNFRLIFRSILYGSILGTCRGKQRKLQSAPSMLRLRLLPRGPFQITEPALTDNMPFCPSTKIAPHVPAPALPLLDPTIFFSAIHTPKTDRGCDYGSLYPSLPLLLCTPREEDSTQISPQFCFSDFPHRA